MRSFGGTIERILVSAVVALSAVALTPASAAAAPQTFYATVNGCGPGSLWRAIQDANANPGVDTIEIDAGVTWWGYLSTLCDTQIISEGRLGTFTESAIVKGNGAVFNGSVQWLGFNNVIWWGGGVRDCPTPSGAYLSSSGKVFEIGEFGKDNSGITVTVDGLHVQGAPQLFTVRSGAALEVSNSRYEGVWKINRPGYCDDAAVDVETGGSFTARDVEFSNLYQESNPQSGGPPFLAAINGTDATINLERVRMSDAQGGFAVRNDGGTARIVSSIFDGAGGLSNTAGSTMEVVNTAWVGRTSTGLGLNDQIHNEGTMRIEASTFWAKNTTGCEAQASTTCPNSAVPLYNTTGATMRLEGTAVGTALPGPGGLPAGYSTPVGGGGTVTNDGFVWIGATRPGGTFASGSPEWIELFVEPDPETASPATGASPGLNGIMPSIDLHGQGILIDRIDNCADSLVNPIDNSTISLDVLGNPRCDANDKRNIGAVQTQNVPHLELVATGDRRVDLTWAAPAPCPEPEVFLGYDLVRFLDAIAEVKTFAIDDPATLTYTDTTVDNGQEYRYQVTARCGVGGVELSRKGPSNDVIATPFGPIGRPEVTAVAGNGEVFLTWTVPDLGGRTLLNYFIVYYPAGTTDYAFEIAIDPAATITGLTNGTDYEFLVYAITTDQASSAAGFAPATPTGPEPSVAPSVEPSVAPSVEPSVAPSVEPSVAPSVEPSVAPSPSGDSGVGDLTPPPTSSDAGTGAGTGDTLPAVVLLLVAGGALSLVSLRLRTRRRA